MTIEYTQVVIPYKASDTTELDYAIKSINRYISEDVLVLDEKAPIDDWGRGSYLNQIAKFKYACETLPCESFLATADDVFILDEYKHVYHNRGTLQEQIELRRSGAYKRSLIETKRWLEKRNLPTLSFELHTPFLYDRLKLLELINMMPKDKQIQIRSLYGNYYGVETEYSEDCKNPVNYRDRPILSTNAVTWRSEIGSYIRSRLV